MPRMKGEVLTNGDESAFEEIDAVDADFIEPWFVEFKTTRCTNLLMHADEVERADDINEWRQDPRNKNLSVRGDDRSPPWTWISYLYHDGTNLAIPQDVIRANLRTGGARVPLANNKHRKSYKELSQVGIDVDPLDRMFFDFTLDGKKVPVAGLLKTVGDTSLNHRDHVQIARDHGFDLFTKRARVGQAKHVRVRPIFRGNWSVSGRLAISVREISKATLLRIFQIAGSSIGIGDWRPSCKTPGPFGRYYIELKQV
jgi:hypothetical protein